MTLILTRWLVYALSGSVWGFLAWGLSPRTPGGSPLDLSLALAIAPVIGILMGELGRALTRRHVLLQGLASVVLLYVAVGLFAAFVPTVDGPEALYTSVVMYWTGLTVFFLWLLWPLALMNFQLVWCLDEWQSESARGH